MARSGQAVGAKQDAAFVGCSVTFAVVVLAAIVAAVVVVGQWLWGRLTADDPPPFKWEEVVRVTSAPASFDDGVRPKDRERPHDENEPFGMNDVKDAIHDDFYPKLGNKSAEVAIDCGGATLEQFQFECIASHNDLKVPYSVRISNLRRTPQYILEPGSGQSYTGLATWEQEVTPKVSPLFRDAVHLRLWNQAHHDEDNPGTDLACDPMPEISLLAPGTVTNYRCHFKGEFGEWATYRVSLNAHGEASIQLDYDDEAR